MSDRKDSLLVRQLARFQRRLRLIAFVRNLSTAVPVALVAIGTLALAARPELREAVIWVAAAVALAVSGAAIAALIGTPSLPATAKVLDGRFRLEDRAVTALELDQHTDPLSRLIVTDARTRLAAHASRELSLEAPPRRHWMSAAVVGVSLLLAIAVTTPSRVSRTDRGAGSGTSGGAVPGGSGDPARTAARTADDPTAGQAAAAQSAPGSPGERADDSRQPGDVAALPQDAARRDVDASASEPGSSRQAGDTAGAARGQEAGADPAAGQSGLKQDPGSRGGAGNGARATVGGEKAARGLGAGGASGVDPGAGPVTGAGGVKGSPPAAITGVDPARNSAASADYATRYRNSRARAESAIAQERVPARLRTLVRDYFAAIGPAGQP